MIFTLTDRQYNVLDSLETDAYLIGQYTSSLLNTLDIDIPVKSLNPEKWVEGNYILCVDKSGTKYWFTITDFSDSLNADVKTLTCYSGSLDVIAEDAVPISAPEAKPFSWYFDSIFYDTGVTLGINEISDLSRKLEYTSDDKSQAEMLQFVLNGFDAEARFEVEFQGSTPNSLKLNVVKHIGKEAVQTVLTDCDDSLTSLDRTGSISELGTCLNLSGGTPDGADKAITLAGKEYVEKDAAGNILYYSPKAHFRIYSVAARNNYFVQLPGKTNGEFDGYINRTYVSEATTQDALWQAGLTKLKSIDHAIFEYTASGKINCNLGDNIQIIAHKMKEEVMISARVIEYKFNDDDDSRNEYTFSNVKELKSQFDQSLIDRVNALIEQTKPYTLSLVSDNGVTFKNIEGETTLSAIVYNGTQVITPDVTVRWYKDDVWVKTGYSLTIEAKNINAKAVYKAIVIDTNGKERATQDVTVFNVDDGKFGDLTDEEKKEIASHGEQFIAYAWSQDGTDRFTRAKPEPTQDELAKDYDNAVPRYIGRSLKDSNSPSDYKWEPNPERKPWVSYAQGLNGEGLSLMPYGEQLQLGTNQPFVMGYGISNTTWKDSWAYLDTKTGNSAIYSEILPQNGMFYNFIPENGKTYTQSIRIKTDGKYNPNNNVEFTWFTTVGHNTQKASILPLNNNEYLVYSTYTWNKTGISLRAFDIYVLYTAFGFRDSAATYLAFKEPKIELANTMGIPTPWTPAPSEDPLGAIPKYLGTAALPYEDFSKYAYTMNPEWADLNATLGLNTKVDNGQYKDDKSQIFEDIANRLTKEEAAEINTIAQKALDMITAYTDPDSGKAAADLNALEQRIVGMVNELGAKIARWNFIDTWMTAGEEGFSIANAKSTTKFLVKNNRMSFINNGEEVAYFSGQSFMIQRGIVTQGMQIGSHKEEALNKDHTVTRWIAS